MRKVRKVKESIKTPFMLAAIDSGAKGAVAILKVNSRTNTEIVYIYDMPFKEDCELPHIQTKLIAEWISGCDYVALESVAPIVGEGTAASMFRQGGSYFPLGEAIDLAGLSDKLRTMGAKGWKGVLNVLGGTNKKKKTFDLCCKCFPDDVKLFSGPRGGMLDGRTDAIGIGLAFIKNYAED